MSTTYEELVDLVLAQAHPERIASRLISKKRRHVQSGLIHLQRKLPHLRSSNTNIVSGDSHYDCGVMVVDAPNGHVKRVMANETGLDPDVEPNSRVVEYWPCGYAEIEARREEWLAVGGIMLDSLGNYAHALPVSRGLFAIHAGSVWAYPAALPPWQLQIKWDGIKQLYQNDDIVDLTESQIDLLIKYVEWAGCGDGGCDRQAKASLLKEFTDALTEETRERHSVENADNRHIRSIRVSPFGFAANSYQTPTSAPP